jgi:hypothetical protein
MKGIQQHITAVRLQSRIDLHSDHPLNTTNC